METKVYFFCPSRHHGKYGLGISVIKDGRCTSFKTYTGTPEEMEARLIERVRKVFGNII